MDKKGGLNPSTAIIIGSILISLSILVSGGVISLKSAKTSKDSAVVQVQPTPQPQQQPQQKTEADIVANLKTYAGKLGLDQNKFNQCLDSGEKASQVSADQKEGNDLGVGGTPSFFVNGRPLFIGASPFAQFKKVIDEELSGSAPAGTERKTVAVGNLPVLGSSSAAVTFVEFSDYQCPFCGRFYEDAEAQIKKEYIDTGKVKFYYRDYPLTQIHPGAEKGAEAARCAGDQGKYWEYHDLVFQNQENIF
ncbi:MAG: thioredoxin domain-containing protein [bacterium]|nr:thioredoxin domain-containing protein [bacterium]